LFIALLSHSLSASVCEVATLFHLHIHHRRFYHQLAILSKNINFPSNNFPKWQQSVLTMLPPSWTNFVTMVFTYSACHESKSQRLTLLSSRKLARRNSSLTGRNTSKGPTYPRLARCHQHTRQIDTKLCQSTRRSCKESKGRWPHQSHHGKF
jgi:hypothetical protein